MNALTFVVNDRPIRLTDAPANQTLLEWLRTQPQLRGTKEGCAEGDCGACTVVVVDPAGDGPRFRAINACLLLLPMCQGRTFYTVEALADGIAPHPAQAAMIEELGSQCGYCTPGVVMSLFEATYRTDLDADWKLNDQLCGNLCRCTGYRPIRDAAARVAGTCPNDRFAAALSQASAPAIDVDYRAQDQAFLTPATEAALWEALETHPDARLICGGTDLSLRITQHHEVLAELISVEAVPGLDRIEVSEDLVIIGAAVSLARIEEELEAELPSLHRMLRYFASRQIKNRGSLGGNLCNASPIGDTPPALLALGAAVELWSRDQRRTVPLDRFFLDYRKTALKPGEILGRVLVPRPEPHTLRGTYKVSKRRELDISTVAAGFYVDVQDNTVAEVRLAFGGMAATPRRATHAEAALRGQPWTAAAIEAAAVALTRDFTPMDDHRGSAWYRSTVAANLLRGFYIETRSQPAPALPTFHSATVLAEVTP